MKSHQSCLTTNILYIMAPSTSPVDKYAERFLFCFRILAPHCFPPKHFFVPLTPSQDFSGGKEDFCYRCVALAQLTIFVETYQDRAWFQEWDWINCLASLSADPDLKGAESSNDYKSRELFHFMALGLDYGLLLYLFSLCVSHPIMIILFVFSCQSKRIFYGAPERGERMHFLNELSSCWSWSQASRLLWKMLKYIDEVLWSTTERRGDLNSDKINLKGVDLRDFWGDLRGPCPSLRVSIRNYLRELLHPHFHISTPPPRTYHPSPPSFFADFARYPPAPFPSPPHMDLIY